MSDLSASGGCLDGRFGISFVYEVTTNGHSRCLEALHVPYSHRKWPMRSASFQGSEQL
ncbi:hypothetical protein RBSH_05321 [Rhodopirellula baltica SH28]|uniref:Uncharacterized protein n=1 Tax=Rhodopirellula baltica SH28 TaxID=993517 RepID=K5C8M0_RHOBT|nr:hypothetical protein RBSH_05321 [Rhodopirellula baltica SH28]